MKLSEIASNLRHDALANLSETQSTKLGQGAVVSMRAELLSAAPLIVDLVAPGRDEYEIEFHLQIQREGKLPNEDTPAYAAWLRELSTFRRQEYFNVPDSVQAEMHAGKRTYAANFVWTERIERTDDTPALFAPKREMKAIQIDPIPQNAEEIKAWAMTLGQGARITGVDVFTGEL